MKYRVILPLAALPIRLSSATTKPGQGNTAPGVCERVTDSRYTSTPWSTSYRLGPERARKADVRLYRPGGKKCCTQNALLSEMSTGHDGGFEFKDTVPGEYRVVVVEGEKKYKSSASLATRAGKQSQECRDFVFQINDDELRVLKMYKAYDLEENAETH
jgi:hypothetical protein